MYIFPGAQGQERNFFRADYRFNPDFSSFYKLHKTGRSWTDAKIRCQREGAILFYPETQAEADFVSTYIKENLKNFPQMWIGISDIIAEGDFETVNGKY